MLVAMMGTIPTTTQFAAARSKRLVRPTRSSMTCTISHFVVWCTDNGKTVTAVVRDSNPGAPKYKLNFSPAA